MRDSYKSRRERGIQQGWILLQENRKRTESGKKMSHRSKDMIHSETDEVFKTNSHHVTLSQSVEEIRLGKG